MENIMKCPHCKESYQYRTYKYQKKHERYCEKNPEVIAAEERRYEELNEQERISSLPDRIVHAVAHLAWAVGSRGTDETKARNSLREVIEEAINE